MGEFEHYNIIFGNNGCGKTSLTRAFELLISKNKRIEKYRTISTAESPSIEFECKDESYTIEPNGDIRVPPFKVEIYNSDFLHNNAPLNSEFGLKKLDDGTIILEGSVLGEETKEINQLKDCRGKVEKRQKKIKDENDSENTLSAKQESEIKKYDKEIEKIRKKMTSNTIKITPDEIGINDFCKVSKDKFKYQEDVLTNLEKDFNKLNEAMKKFDGLKEMELPKDYQTIKDKLEFLFSFDIDKEAGEVSKKIKEHISKVGREFIEKGIKLQKEMPDNACPFCTQKILNGIIQDYTSYFNKSIESFNQNSLNMSETLKNTLNQWNIKKILQSFERFEPFMKKDFSTNKESLEKALEQIKALLEELQKEVDKKEGLKNLVVVIDDPISSLDEQRIYNTTCLVAKINQELVGEALENKDKVQVFVLTHNHTFMACLINMVDKKHARYFQLERHQGQLKIVCKNEAVGYFDTFYLLLFKEVYEFATTKKVQDDFKEAINYGNKVRVLLESFLKINFINPFLGANSVFDEGKIKKLIETANGEVELNFSNLPFNEDNNCNIENKDMLLKKILRIVKGLHLDSHGSVMDFFSPYKISLENVQEFAKIAINAMKILNPYQTKSYMESVGNKN
ncbi:AAA family ATPase [Helicobacter pylori]